MLVVDEIQTGLGRLGAWWGCEREGVTPDILLTGKALGGGVMPVAAAVSTVDAYGALDAEPFLHSSTFAGNPLAAAAVTAALRVMHGDDVPRRAAELGRVLLGGVREAVSGAGDVVRDVRGEGLMIGIEFREEHHGARFLELMLDQHVIVCYSLNSDNVVRLTPSYLLDEADCEWLVTAISTSVRALTKS
jgi:putrescine aminotransferase